MVKMEKRGVDNKFSGHLEKSAEWKLFYNARKMIEGLQFQCSISTYDYNHDGFYTTILILIM